ncbi:MAG: NUDIX hydrolase [Trueperaceae bacterium]|nr:NUDIX hydrolase [Trueperaceae bacterium]
MSPGGDGPEAPDVGGPQAERHRETIWTGRIVTLEVLDGRYEVARHANAVSVLATRPSGEVLGVIQDRPAIGREAWELPAGLIEPGEEPARAAERELREETQFTANLTFVTRMFVSPGFTDEEVVLYQAGPLTPAAGQPDEGEELRVVWREPREVWREVAAGRTATSAVTLLGLRHLLAGRGETP